jgi:tRNA pseudouridine13 synthase
MKLKVRPEDFIVEERIDLTLSPRGAYTILKLVKNSWNTLDAIDFAARQLGIAKGLIARAGLKDRYALATQYLSYRGDLRRGLKEKNLSLTPIGKSDRPIAPDILLGNQFKVTLRSLDAGETDKLTRNFREVVEAGLPNYFDDQRFGSAWHRQGFFARRLIMGHYEGALKLILAYPYADESRPAKSFKKYCRENWGHWDEIFTRVPRADQKVVAYLVQNPGDYRGAIKQLDREMLNLYLLAYQSYILNETLSQVIRERANEIVELPYSVGKLIFSRGVRNPEALVNLEIPMVNEKTCPVGLLGPVINGILEREGLRIKDFSLNKMRFRGVRFKSFFRRAFVFPENFNRFEPEKDELYPGRTKVRLEFTLPSGSYATILIKRLLI